MNLLVGDDEGYPSSNLLKCVIAEQIFGLPLALLRSTEIMCFVSLFVCVIEGIFARSLNEGQCYK